jgi:Ca2+-binding EF-hand superfamily protein
MQKEYENLQARFMKYDEKNKGFINSAEVESLINGKSANNLKNR